MPLKAGTSVDFADSLAAAIENALADEYQAAKGQALPSAGQVDRRMLFAAIAQGVVKHLQQNPDAFKVRVDGVSFEGAVNNIETTGTLYS